MTTPRYTIHLSIYEIDEEGFPVGDEQEYEGVTLDYATTDLEMLVRIMDFAYDEANLDIQQWKSDGQVTDRRLPEEEDGEEISD